MRDAYGAVIDFYSLKPLPDLFVPIKSAYTLSSDGGLYHYLDEWLSTLSSLSQGAFGKFTFMLRTYNYVQSEFNYESAVRALDSFITNCSLDERDDFYYVTLVNYKDKLVAYHESKKLIDVRARVVLQSMANIEKHRNSFVKRGYEFPSEIGKNDSGVHDDSLPEVVVHAIKSINEDGTGYEAVLDFVQKHIYSYSEYFDWLNKGNLELYMSEITALTSAIDAFELEVFFYQK